MNLLLSNNKQTNQQTIYVFINNPLFFAIIKNYINMFIFKYFIFKGYI